MKALMIVRRAGPGPNCSQYEFLASAFGQLHAFGITYDRMSYESLSSGAISNLHNSYDFVLIPEYTGSMASFFDNANLNLPVLVLYGDANAAAFGSTPGVTGSRTGIQDEFVDVPWSTEPWFALNGRSIALDGGTSLMTVSATNPIDDSAQSDSGNTMMWSSTMAGGKKLYVSMARPNIIPALGFLLQAAIDDGEITTPAKRKAPIVVDLDHINGEFTNADLNVLPQISSRIPASGITWAGIQNNNTDNFENLPAATAAALAAEPRFKYCYHSHRSSGAEQPNTGAWPNFTDQITKAQQDSIYDADKATWEGHGLTFHTPAYYNAGANNWNEATLELFSEDSSKMSDGASATTKAGKGYRAFRTGTGRNATRVGPADDALYYNQNHRRMVHRGIQIFLTRDLALNSDLPFDAITDWRNQTRRLFQIVHFGLTGYLHDEDFQINEQGPSETDKQHGRATSDMVADMGEYLKDLTVLYANPIDYVMPRHSQGVNGIQY